MAGTDHTTEAAISDWLASLSDANVTRLELRPAAASVSIWRRPFPANADGAKLASLALERAKSRGLGMPCVRATFFLLAFDSSGGDHIDEQTIVVPGGNAGKGDSAEEGTANERLISHLLKAQSDLHRLLISSREGHDLASDRLVQSLAAQLDSHEKRRIATLDLYEKLQDRQLQRDIQSKTFLLTERRDAMLERKIDQLTPIVVNRLMGGGPGKGTPFMGEEMVRQLLSALDPATIDKLMAGLPAEQSALFAELYLAYAAAEEKRKVNDGAAPAASTNGANGANGSINGKGDPPS
jgi:hypothetical protein